MSIYLVAVYFSNSLQRTSRVNTENKYKFVYTLWVIFLYKIISCLFPLEIRTVFLVCGRYLFRRHLYSVQETGFSWSLTSLSYKFGDTTDHAYFKPFCKKLEYKFNHVSLLFFGPLLVCLATLSIRFTNFRCRCPLLRDQHC